MTWEVFAGQQHWLRLGFSCADFDLPAPSTAHITGKAVELAVRPENVAMASAGAGGTANGKVVERVFLGNLCEYQILLASGRTLRAQTHPTQLFDADENVSITIRPDLCSIFDAQPGKTS